jgi:hypothetical protein
MSFDSFFLLEILTQIAHITGTAIGCRQSSQLIGAPVRNQGLTLLPSQINSNGNRTSSTISHTIKIIKNANPCSLRMLLK